MRGSCRRAKRLAVYRMCGLASILGIIQDVDVSILNELMIFMQPGFLQQYAGTELSQEERDIFRAKLFRERLTYSECIYFI